MLFLSANPQDTTQLGLVSECNNIDEKIRSTPYARDFDLVQRHEVQLSKLQSHLLNLKPHVVHFSGHGSAQGQLIFQNELGIAQEAPIESVANLFRILNQEAGLPNSSKIRLVILNACYSEKQAKAIAKYVDCVVGMSTEVSDESARKFAESFYNGLGHGKSVKDAYELACNQLGLEKIPENTTPKLKVREGISPSGVILATPATPAELGQHNKVDLRRLAIVGTVIGVAVILAVLLWPPPPGDELEIHINGDQEIMVNNEGLYHAITSGGSGEYEYYWEFDDGTNSTTTDESVRHTYVNPGRYVISVEVRDSSNAMESNSLQVTVVEAPEQIDVRSIVITMDGVTVDENVLKVYDNLQFEAQVAGGEGQYSYLWNFGDGQISNSREPIHAFLSSGPYMVSATVTDEGRSEATRQISITIRPSVAPLPDLTVLKKGSCLNVEGNMFVRVHNYNNFRVEILGFGHSGENITYSGATNYIGEDSEAGFYLHNILNAPLTTGDRYDISLEIFAKQFAASGSESKHTIFLSKVAESATNCSKDGIGPIIFDPEISN